MMWTEAELMGEEVYLKMEACAQAGFATDAASEKYLLTMLNDDNWRVQYAAAIALGDRRSEKALEPLLAVLQQENQAPLYTQPKLDSTSSAAPAGTNIPFQVFFPAGTSVEEQEAWRRRGRVKQAICLALGNIGISMPQVLAALHRLAIDQKEDYAVRAAACKALGQIGDPASVAYLEKATADEEWCTRTEATKALQAIRNQTAAGTRP